MQISDPVTWPERPHLGGPLPVLANAYQTPIGLALCDYANAIAPPRDAKQLAKLRRLASRVVDGERVPRETLDAPSKGSKQDDVATRVAKMAVRCVLNYLYAAPSARNAVGTCLENASVAIVQESMRHGIEATRAYLVFVDQQVMRAELAQMLGERTLEPTAEVELVVSRPHVGTKVPGLVLAQLAGGSYGLLVKQKLRWTWHEGDRASMFATVPDELMERVAADLP